MQKPNVLLVMTDQQRWDTLGVYGNPVIKTPNLDEIGNNGIVLCQHFAQSAICGPSRASLLTGRYPSAHRLTVNGKVLPDTEKTLADILLEAGYQTAGFGKLHFKNQKREGEWEAPGVDATDCQPREFPHHGFSHFELLEDSMRGFYEEYLKANGFTPKLDLDSSDIGQWKVYRSHYPEEHYSTSWIASRAIDWLRGQSQEAPFFLFVSFVDPHPPFHAPAPFDEMYETKQMPLPVRDAVELEKNPYIRDFYYGKDLPAYLRQDYSTYSDTDWQRFKASYYGKISLIDTSVGKILSTLRELHQLENTVVIFTSDHGMYLGDHWLLYKGYHHECGVKVPFLMSFPSNLPQGQVIEKLTCAIDIVPTICDLCRIPIPSGVQGKSLLPLILKKEEGNESVFVEDGPMVTLRDKDWRITVMKESYCELYNLRRDPMEFNNLYYEDEYARDKVRLLQKLIEKQRETSDPLPEQRAMW